MTRAEQAFYDAIRRKMATVQPDVARSLLRGFRLLRESLDDAALARLLEEQGAQGLVDALLSDDVFQRAFLPLRVQLRQTAGDGFEAAIRFLPAGGKIDGQLAVAFDVLDPIVLEAVRALDSRVIRGLAEETRETVRAFVEDGLREGIGPRTIAKGLRSVVGLAPNQEQAVRNYRKALDGTGGSPTDYALRDKRYDRLTMTPVRIDAAVNAYRRRFIAWNAETNARTATNDSFKLGQDLAWKDAQAKGIVTGPVQKTWIGVMDARERPEHVAMQGETVPIDSAFSNGEMVPGESTYNCRCISRYTLAKAA